MKSIGLLVSLFLAGQSEESARPQPVGQRVAYRAVLLTPAGELPFLLEVSMDAGTYHGTILNGSERVEIPKTSWTNRRLTLEIDHYDSTIEAVSEEGSGASLSRLPQQLRGKWRKRSGKDQWAELDFFAKPYPGFRFAPLRKSDGVESADPDIVGRWAVRFSKSEDAAVGIFRKLPDGQIEGTFLTTTGDYRFLAGSYEYGRLRLSCFDGAHAFLFDARVQPDGTLRGDFQSRDAWHETWTAVRDEQAVLPDAFSLTHWTGSVPLSAISFPDLEGQSRSLDDPAFKGKARIIEVFGSWCPNCHDASRFLADLDRRYKERGLRIVGLAFELTGDFQRDAAQVRKFAKSNGVEYPVLIAGTNDKTQASSVLPILDRVRGYPTTILLREDGSVAAVHTGFSGPATGEEHDQLRKKFEGKVRDVLEGR